MRPSTRGWSEAEGADAGGSPAILQAAENFALEQDRIGDRHQRNDEHDGDLDDREEQEDFEVVQVAHRIAINSQSAEARWSATSVDWWRWTSCSMGE